MKALLHVTSGGLAGRRVLLRPGEPLRVGRSGRADLVVSQDEKMAAVHFEIAWDGAACRIRDVGRKGTKVDEKIIEEAEVRDGGSLRAGETTFLLRLQSDDLRVGLPPTLPRPPPSAERLSAQAAALDALQAAPGPLFAILDGARDRRIPALLRACEDENRSLFEGTQGEVLARGAPYLVRLARGSELLPVLVSEGWGESWGVYLTSKRPLREVRQRLRRSLVVTDEETKKRLYFRFYDPRVLRLYLPACSARQRSEILGTEIEGFLLEGAAGDVLRF